MAVLAPRARPRYDVICCLTAPTAWHGVFGFLTTEANAVSAPIPLRPCRSSQPRAPPSPSGAAPQAGLAEWSRRRSKRPDRRGMAAALSRLSPANPCPPFAELDAQNRLQPFRHLHDCSGCFRLERSPGGTCTHWKAPPSHGAHVTRTSQAASVDGTVGGEQTFSGRA
jgi:hypothetical protein